MITLALLAAVFGLALVDSINPSALLVTGLILTLAPQGQKISAICSYVAGVYAANFVFGLVLLLGLHTLVTALGDALDSKFSYMVQAVLGGIMLAWALFSKPSSSQHNRFIPKGFSFKLLFSLGVGVTLAEAITAFPYFGAIGLLQRADLALPIVVAILAVYNIIFVLPPLILAALYRFNRVRFDAWLQKRRRKTKPSDTLQWIVGILGVLLLLDAAYTLGLLK